MFSICHRHCLSRCFFVGQVMFSHHPDQMSQRSKVSKIALWRCSLNVFVIVIVFSSSLSLSFTWSDHVFVTLSITCLKGQDRSVKVFSKCLCICICICLCHSLCLCLCNCLCRCLSVGQVMFSHHYYQMYQRSHVSRISLFVLKSKVFHCFEWHFHILSCAQTISGVQILAS